MKRSQTAKDRKRRQRHQSWIDAYKVAVGCIDCGYNAHPSALDFDHRDWATKHFTISGRHVYKMSRERLAEEIAKCDVRCANCHRVRTSQQRLDALPALQLGLFA